MKKVVVANIKNKIENGELEKTYKNTGDFKCKRKIITRL